MYIWGMQEFKFQFYNRVLISLQLLCNHVKPNGIPLCYDNSYMPHMYIQGDSGGICNTLGNDSMCDSKQKSLYKHWSDFGPLWSYDRLKLRIEGNDY